jgi:hypothetical protein
MRFILLLLPTLALGCGSLACRDHTLLVSFTLASGVSADALEIKIDVAGSAKTSPLSLKSGTTHGSIEVDFPAGYPNGATIDVTILATLKGAPVGSGVGSTTASGSCEKLSVAIAATTAAPPDGGVDMSPMANKHQGDACSATDVCDTGHCIDGYCCNDVCAGQCQACDVDGSPGICTTTSDAVPHGSRPACAGSGTCGGACTGASATACTFPATSVICGAACDGHCDAAGSCTSTAGGACPNGLACGATGCNTTCAIDADCQPNFHCAAPSCVRNVETDCLDGKDNNGDGLADCQDPTCTTVVQCVTAVPAGDEFGIEQATGTTCPTSFALTEPQNQGLVAPACDTSGCGCNEYVTCDVSLAESTATSCSPRTTLPTLRGEHLVTTANDLANVQPCENITSTAINGYVLNSINHVSDRCAKTGSTSPSSATWSKRELFCGSARTSATCTSASQVCVPVQPASAPLCVRIPSNGASCPGGYDSGMSAMWYASYTDTRTCACDCTPGTGACNAGGSIYAETAYQTGSCPVAGSSGAPGWSLCTISHLGQCIVPGSGGDILNYCSTPAAGEAVGSISLLDFIVAGQCTTTVDNSGSATPTQGSTICCQ